MNSFSVTRKKTPFQKHREEEEAKKKRVEDETARLYQEFLESFQGEDTPGSKTFVRGGTIDPNGKAKIDSEGGKSKDGESVPKKGSRYVPSFLPPPSSSRGRESEKKKEDERPKEREKGKPRNIDNFMEELKREQELREKRNHERGQKPEGHHVENPAPSTRFDELPDEFDPFGKLPGIFDDVDPQTTNLYVGNLSPQVDENFLLRTFGRFGPIASVKIMWPRTEDERKRQRNCGFVAFMNRADGQDAMDEMQGVVVYEYELKIGWGKSVSLPGQALPAPPPGQMAIRSKEGATVILSGPAGPPITSVPNQGSELVLTPNVPDIRVDMPVDDHLRHVIDTMALYVLDGGCAFEQAIMERGRGNPLFSFLFELGSKEHTYYVWRLYSFAQGDTLQRWRTEPFIMITGSGRWIPPSLPLAKSLDLVKESGSTFAAGKSKRVDLERTLTDPQRDEFEDMLRALTLERRQIKEAMGFSLDNADAAGEIVEILTESLTLKETAIPTKVARLMLVSDILHNSSAPVRNASAYRTKFEATLPDIMESFNDLYCSVTGRITAQALKERVMKVVQVWADWFLFSESYVNGLRATFLRSGSSGVIPFHSICGDAPEIENRSDLPEGVKQNQDVALAMGKGAAMKELMNLPFSDLERRCRHNGLSFVGGREMMVARLLSLEEEDEGGYNRDRNFSRGVETEKNSPALPYTLPIPQPELRAFARKTNPDPPVLPVSKWAREDAQGLALNYSSSGSDDVTGGINKDDEDLEVGNEVSTTSVHPDSGINEEQRQKLRRLEVAVMEYRESLEDRGIRSPNEIERKVDIQRRRLQSEFGLADSNDGTSGKKRSSQERHDESSKKRSRSRSRSPLRRRSTKSKERENDGDHNRNKRRDRGSSYEMERQRGSRERDGHERDRRRR